MFIEEGNGSGNTNSVANVRVNPVLIQSDNSVVNISGVDEGMNVVVYSANGQTIGSTKACGNNVSVNTNLKKGEIAIVKIGEKSVIVVMQ